MLSPARVQFCSECRGAVSGDARSVCPRGCLVHPDCWRRRNERSLGVFLSELRCGGCWTSIPIERKRSPEQEVDDRPEHRARFIAPPVVVPGPSSSLKRKPEDDTPEPRPRLSVPPTVPVVIPTLKRAMDDQMDPSCLHPAVKRAREDPSQTLRALDLPPPRVLGKRTMSMELLNVAMKRARM